MTIEWMFVTGAATIAAMFIWYEIKTQRKIYAIDARLAQMQKEVDILRVQESRRAIIAFRAKSKEEAPGIEPRDSDPVNVDGGDVVRLTGTARPMPA